MNVKETYPKTADLRQLFYGINAPLLLLTYPQGNALHTPEKAKTEMISVKAI